MDLLESLQTLVGLARAAAVALFLAGGVLRIACWRITRETHDGRMGSALLLLGGLSLPLVALVRGLVGDQPGSALVPLTRGVTTAAVLVLVGGALLRRRQREDGGVARRVLPLAVASSVIVVGLLLLDQRAPYSLPAALSNHVVGLLLGAAWACLAAAAWRKGRTEPWARHAAPLLGAMAVAELFRLPAQLPGTVVAALLTAGVACLVVGSALRDLIEATRREQDLARALSTDLDDALALVTSYDERREELTHDARNALAGVRAAIATLESYGDRLDDRAVGQLRRAALGELAHLEHLVVRDEAAGDCDFDVVDVLADVAEARRAAGLDLSCSLEQARGHGVPGDLVTVVQNLLVNAQRHAAGASVTMRCGNRDGRVEIEVSDDGPGMDDTVAACAFERGSRRANSRGSGLGLYVARTLMRQQGGDVELRDHVGGTRFVVWLPRAQATRALPTQRRPGQADILFSPVSAGSPAPS